MGSVLVAARSENVTQGVFCADFDGFDRMLVSHLAMYAWPGNLCSSMKMGKSQGV